MRESGKKIAVLKAHKAAIAPALSGDGKRVLTASDDGIPRIWDTDSGNEIAVLKGHDLPVTTAALSRRWQAGGGSLFGKRRHLGCGER